jgi:hypothetical protein
MTGVPGVIGGAVSSSAPVTLEYGPNGFVTAIVTIGSVRPEPFRIIIQEPASVSPTSAMQSVGIAAPLNGGGPIESSALLGGATSLASINRDDPASWPRYDTLGTSLRVRTVVGGVPTSLALLSIASGDTLFVGTRSSRLAANYVRSDRFTFVAEGQRIDIDLTGTLASLDQPGSRETIPVRAAEFAVQALASCARGAFNLFSPNVLSAQAVPKDCSAQQTTLSQARELRGYARGLTAATLAGGAYVIATTGWTGLGLIGGGIALVTAGFTHLAGEATYNFAEDALWQCTSGSGDEPPRCKGPTIGKCKPGLK